MQNKLWTKEFTAITSSNLLMAATFYALIPALPVYLTGGLGISHGNTGLIMAAFSIASIITRPFAGYLVDNFNRFLVFIVALALMTALLGVYPLVSGVAAMFVLRFVHGGSWGLASTSAPPIVADAVPALRLGEGMGIFAMSIPVGMTVGPAFSLSIMDRYGFTAMFLTILGISLIALLIAFYAKTPSRKIARKKFAFTRLINGKALPLSLCMFFIMFAYGAIVIFVGVYAAQKGFTNVATFFFCLAAATFFSRLILSRLFDRGYVSHLVIGGVVLALIGVPLLGIAWNQAMFLLAGIANGLGFGMLMPTCQAAINNMVDTGERGSANSTYLVSYDLGVGTGSLCVGFLSDRIAFAQIYGYCTILVVLAAAIFVFAAIPHYHRSIRERAAAG